MSEFELSTLAMLAVLLACLAAYSYWQVARAGRRQGGQSALSDSSYDEAMLDETPEMYNTNAPLLTLSNEESGQQVNDAAVSTVSVFPAKRLPDGYAAVSYVPVKRSVAVEQPVVMQPESGLANMHYHLVDDVPAVQNDSVPEIFFTQTAQEISPAQEPELVFQSEIVEESSSGVLDLPEPEPVVETLSPESIQKSIEQAEPLAYYVPQDTREQASLSVFEPLIRFSSWVETSHPSAIHALDGVIDLLVQQPKHAQDIEKALYDLRLDTDLSLRLYGRRAGSLSNEANWQPLEPSVLYSGLRLTLQLANRDEYAQPHLIQDWFLLAQRLAKRLAAQIQAMPDPAALGSYAMYLHDLSKRLGAPLMIQLRKKQGLWPAYEVHQHMTQEGLVLGDHGQYLARADDGRTLYQVGNDLGNLRAQDFFRDQLPTMHVHTLSFCLDVSRVPATYLPMTRLCHDAQQIALSLDAQWLNGQGAEIFPEALLAHADVHVPAYVAQLEQIGVPAGSVTMRRLLATRSLMGSQ